LSLSRKLGILLYVAIIIQTVVGIVHIYLRAEKKPDMYRLLACHVIFLIWVFNGIAESLANGTPMLPLAIRFTILPVSITSAFMLRFAVHYSGLVDEKHARRTYLFFLPIILSLAPLYLNWHPELVIKKMVGFTAITEWGPFFLANTYLSYVFLSVGALLIFLKLVREGGFAWQKSMLVLAFLVTIVLNYLTLSGRIEHPGFDVTVFGISLILFVLWDLIARFKMIDIVPQAAYSVYSRLRDGILITDNEGTFMEHNLAAETHFQELFDLTECRNIRTFLLHLNHHVDDKDMMQRLIDIIDHSNSDEVDAIGVLFPNGDIRQFDFNFLSIRSDTGKTIGRLLQWRDVTVNRMLTVEKERLRLSDDLHDSLGNCLNIISSNLEYVLDHYENADNNRQYIQKSYDRTIGAFLDMRRIVDELNPIELEKNGLVWALKSLFGKLGGKGIDIDFYCSEPEHFSLLNGRQSETLYFICQEALNNAITHGHAKTIDVILNVDDHVIKLYITDDGIGCDAIIENKGLKSIRNRTESVKGVFEYGSPTDGGFNLKVFIPTQYELITHPDKGNTDRRSDNQRAGVLAE